MRIVVAVGGNALLERGERPDAEVQRRHVAVAARALAPLAREHTLVICHGNGPQIGLLAVESEHDGALSAPYPLDVLGAQTQGMIGYWLAQELGNAGVRAPVVPVLTRTVVAADDPAFAAPTKFIGGAYPQRAAERLGAIRGWTVARDGSLWRRVVASPTPLSIVEMDTVQVLVNTGAVVVCGGGGGVPVVIDSGGTSRGVQAVVDKDLVCALVASRLGADRMLVLTDVDSVKLDFGTPRERPLRLAAPEQLRSMHFPAGSMGPKIDACIQFVEATGRPAAIGTLAEASAVLAGDAGTTICPANNFEPVTT